MSYADFYRENGYLVIEDALDRAEVEALRRETVSICRGERGAVAGLPEVLPADSDADVIKRTLCVHFPHKISAVMLGAIHHPVVVDALTQMIGPNVKCMQSMLFIKAAGKPGQAWHQDEDFIPTRDRSLVGAWIALDDATVENGCLWIIPGSHKPGILWQMVPQADARFDCTDVSVGFPYRDEDAIPVEVRAGAIVFFNGYTLHRSLPNTAATGFRRALVNHYMSAESLLPWRKPKEDEWVSTLDHRDIIMVAGRDPYAWRGTQDVMFPHIRPDKHGGCKYEELVNPNAALVGTDDAED
jgi:ectoine hydroxylase-related dioxygenase (phytanoyl-CoA dioxygenase family)